ncbi:MAG: ABC transporter permease [Bacteroidota bacterium]
MQEYSQLKAMLAITKASLRGIFRSPSAVVFGFAFPFIFILVFGFIGNSGMAPVYKIALDKNSDTANTLFDSIKSSSRIKVVRFADEKELRTSLEKGKITGILNIQKNQVDTPAYTYSIKTTTASNDKWPQLMPVINSIVSKIDSKKYNNIPTYAIADFNYKRDVEEIREYKTIDFILPGQLGFSLLSSGVFGVAFMFFSLRNTLVLKRFFATPISRTYIVLGEGLARVLFQLLTAIVIIVVGRFAFGFTLINGIETLLEMLFLSFLGLLVFMGFGFIISGIAKNESTIPPLANIITLPQFLLSGTFFSIDAFPAWLQIIAKMLPLTYLNMAMRSVAFEGVHFWEVTTPLFNTNFQIPVVLIIVFWGIIAYTVAVKVFKWE